MNKTSASQKAFKEKQKRYQEVAESRRNMRIDMRPKVVAKTMTKELMLLAFALAATACKSHFTINLGSFATLLFESEAHS
jgi:tRNA(Glu) U13 pseudouridine synthase TruD